MIIQIGNTKIDLDTLKGYTKTVFKKKFKSIFVNPDIIYEQIKDKIPKGRSKKK